MQININEENDLIIISPVGNLDTINSPEFLKILLETLESKPKQCFIDMQNIEFLSSSGLQAILSGAKTSQKHSIRFGIIGMNEMVDEVFTISGFKNFISTFSTKEDALA